MNFVDYIIIIILILSILKGFKLGLLPTIVNFVGTFLVFIIAFYIKEPISMLLYENLPFLSFGGIFKGVVAVNILFYEAMAYGLAIVILGIVFGVLKKFAVGLNTLVKVTVLFNLPSKIAGAIIGLLEGILYCFILLFIASVINTTTKYVNESKYASIILNKIPIINNVTGDLISSGEEIYDVVLKNKNNTNKANLESIDILMKYDILSVESLDKLVDDKKLKINGVESVINKYRGEEK